MLALYSKEGKRLQVFEVGLVFKDFSQVGSVVLKVLWLEEKVPVCILVLKLEFVLFFDVNLGIQMDHMVEQLALIATPTHFIAAAHYKDL